MKKKMHPLRQKGFEIEKIPTHMLDSIWRKEDLLAVVFATGYTMYFGNLDLLQNTK